MKLWPFSRRPEPEPPRATLDSDALDRLLRAGVQIPFDWFLLQPPEVQQTIAERRDQYLEDMALMLGLVLQDPEGMRLAVAAEEGDEDAEGELAARAAKAIAAHLARSGSQGAAGAPQPPTRPTMAGVGQRRAQAAAAREAGKRKPSLSAFGGAAQEASG